MAMYLDENPLEIPWDAIRYLIAEALDAKSRCKHRLAMASYASCYIEIEYD